MDARDSLDHEDSIGSAKPPKPPKPPRDRERTRLLLLQVISVAAVVAAVFSGITAWETHRSRAQERDLYCAFYPDPDEQSDDQQFEGDMSEAVRDALDC
ncbi:hypothetical protein [Nocardioides mangrovi]|uniref:Uncharacterized protein n=1 Tax=Nocardioides mangrovi TaxID=2874580 RepID=A0ABS7U7C6_9ACTN|nr:hypothetical protein [Nocardioides mangrovi]MBZ5736785.1 hypothetical protein [Nocardioides mangrovi]